MTTVYLHIGMPKTGTTSLQGFLFHNREKLLKKSVLYPLSRNEQSLTDRYGHNKLLYRAIVNKLNQNSDLELGYWQDLHQEIEQTKAQKVILSAESFYRLESEGIYLLKSYLKNYNTKIIVYLRRQDEQLISSYCQEIKMIVYSNSFKQFVLDRKFQYDYYQNLSPWIDVFGKRNIAIRSYNEAKSKNGLIDDFLEAVDLEFKGDIKEYNSKINYNITPNYKVIKIMQFFNKIAIKNKIAKKILHKLYTIELQKSDSKVFALLSNIPDYLISNQLISEEDRINIMKEFEESNRKVAEEYLGRQDGKLFGN